MTREARAVVVGVAHHITQHGNNRQDVFFVDDDRRYYLHMLKAKAERYGLVVHAYCLMTNHVHIVATRPACCRLTSGRSGQDASDGGRICNPPKTRRGSARSVIRHSRATPWDRTPSSVRSRRSSAAACDRRRWADRGRRQSGARSGGESSNCPDLSIDVPEMHPVREVHLDLSQHSATSSITDFTHSQ